MGCAAGKHSPVATEKTTKPSRKSSEGKAKTKEKDKEKELNAPPAAAAPEAAATPPEAKPTNDAQAEGKSDGVGKVEKAAEEQPDSTQKPEGAAGVAEAVAPVPEVGVRLLGHQMSQPCRSVQWYIKYAGLDVPVQYIDLGEGENLDMGFITKHPAGEVPALEDNGFYLSESIAILQYLSHDDDEINKSTSTPADRARVNSYLARHLSQVRQLTTECFAVFMMSAPHKADDVLEESLESVRHILEVWDKRLKDQKYIVGDQLSLGDFMFAPEVDQLQVLGLLGDFPSIQAYLGRLSALKGYTDVLTVAADMINGIVDAKRKRVGSIAARQTLLSEENSVTSKSSQRTMKRDPMILRGHPVSCPCRSVQWYIEYRKLGKVVRVVPTKVLEGETKTEEFLEKHPAGEIPALEDGDFYLSESVAILQYLAVDDTESNPLADGADSTKAQRARLREYFARHLSVVRKISTECFSKAMLASAEDQAATLQAGMEAIAPILQHYEKHFAPEGQGDAPMPHFLLGKQFTLADVLFAPEVDQLLLLNLLEPYPNLCAYLRRLDEIEGYTKNFQKAKQAVEAFSSQ
eukprot:TRINITY_DN31906_c1_g1_i1.p1 TRINITY_DN31906_c1_g1~~TRINITY_DN31906_c1_g1_i1.p1  ORF type:complete len:577 (+),score=227.09 TRINITY_DN31906_c1_g1_i1:155-1885(+)